MEGEGLVRAYLLSPKTGDRFLVYSNDAPKGSAMSHITGLATIEVLPGPKLDIIETTENLAGEDSFVNECVETCTLDSGDFRSDEFLMDVIVEPGASVTVSRMRFVIAR